MKLGEMLIRDGRLTEEQLQEGIAFQGRDGGRLGSVLVELGYIDAETLTVYLGLELGIPIASGATLERCKRSAVRLLKPEQAARFRCIPVVIQGQTLIVAMDDPHDMPTLDALSGITGYRIIPRVAPEIRLYYYLERFYGVRRPPRFRKLGDAPRGSRAKKPEHQDLPAPPLPGLPPQRQSPEQPPTPPPVVRTMKEASQPSPPAGEKPPPPPPPPDLSPEHQAIATEAADLVVELEADETEAATPAEATAKIERSQPRPRTDEAAVYEPLDLDAAVEHVEKADQRSDIADAILGYAARLFEVSALLLVRDNMAFGWKGFGPGLDRDRIETLLVPLEVPSIFQVALHSDHLFRGRAFPANIHNHLFKILRCSPPSYSVVVVIAIGERVVNILYGHRPEGKEISETDVEELRALAAAASEAYVRLITVSKRKPAPRAQSASE